jgi:hypothetical protein
VESLFYELNRDLENPGDSFVDLIKFLAAGCLYKSRLLNIPFGGTVHVM